MAKNYYQRTRNLFDPASKLPFKISRSRLENFIKCPRCFYMDRRLGVEPPGSPPYTLNSAVDTLLKKEFDDYRRKQKPHPLMTRYGVDAIPFAHPMIDEWREVFKGVRCPHPPTNFIVFGAVDDLWVSPGGELYVVDYKSTSSREPITLDGVYKQAYKRQMEIYQWLLRGQSLKVSDTGYFVFCNADKSRHSFDGRLEFGMEIIPYAGNSNWVEKIIYDAYQCLCKDDLPDFSPACEHCNYLQSAGHLKKPLSEEPAPPQSAGRTYRVDFDAAGGHKNIKRKTKPGANQGAEQGELF